MELLQDDLMPAKPAPLATNASERRPYFALQAPSDLHDRMHLRTAVPRHEQLIIFLCMCLHPVP